MCARPKNRVRHRAIARLSVPDQHRGAICPGLFIIANVAPVFK